MVRGKFHLNVLIYILYVIVTGVEHVHDLIYITLLKNLATIQLSPGSLTTDP